MKENKNGSISEYRDRLDKTLLSHDLTDVETLRARVKNQFKASPQIDAKEDIDNIVEIRTGELSNFLGMLRSTSDDGWNVKQDTEEYRVMYREGPKGSPFNTLLVEGFVDGPLDVCLCISFEAELYPKWWPQTVVPAFKIISSRCLKKIRTGEQICLIRMKVSWPLSAREALVHYFVFEYFQDDLVVVLFNSISDLGGISKSTHGYTRDGIPDAEDVIRIDVIGGFAIQKVSGNRSFFRTIANMDIKLDFIPPALINFISRQLVGSGFKLYKKEVDLVAKGDEDFGKALTDPLYARIREAKYGESLSTIFPQSKGVNNKSSVLSGEPYAEEHETETTVNKLDNNNHVSDLDPKDSLLQEKTSQQEIVEIKNSEIEEIKEEEEEDEDEEKNKSMNINANISSSSSSSSSYNTTKSGKEIVIRPEVEKALRTLEMAITAIRQRGLDDKTPSSHNIEKDGAEISVSSDAADQIRRKDGMRPSSSLLKEDPEIVTSNEARNSSSSIGSRRQSSNSYLRDTNHNKIAPASPNENGGAVLSGTCHDSTHASMSLASRFSASRNITHENYDNTTDQQAVVAAGNDINDNRQQRKKRKPRFRCFAWR